MNRKIAQRIIRSHEIRSFFMSPRRMMKEPDYKLWDTVKFNAGYPIMDIHEGVVYVVDRYGTFGQSEEPSYDIMVESENCLYKHIRESLIIKDEEE